MHVDIQVVKKHWKPLLGALVGLLILFYLLKRGSAGSAASSGDLSGGAGQVQALSAAASLQNGQVNGQIAVAQIQGQVAAVSTAAQLQADLARTAAELDATNHQTNAAVAIASLDSQSKVSIQSIQSQADVQKTAIVGATLDTLGAQSAAVKMQQQQIIAGQINQIFKGSKHFQADIRAFAPAIALESGQGYVAPGLANADAAQKIANSPGATITAATSGLSKILSGFLG